MKQTIITVLTLATFSTMTFSPVFAKEQSVPENTQITSSSSDYSTNLNELSQYVTVENNQYVMNLPNNADIPSNVINDANAMINYSNQQIKQNNLTIDPVSKIASSSGIQTRSWGKNKVEFHWNYVRVYIDAGNLRLYYQVGVAALGGALAAVAENPLLIGAISGVTTGLGMQADKIKDGIWYDYNFILRQITQFGKQ